MIRQQHHRILRLARRQDVGLFCRYIGFICGYVGLFWHRKFMTRVCTLIVSTIWFVSSTTGSSILRAQHMYRSLLRICRSLLTSYFHDTCMYLNSLDNLIRQQHHRILYSARARLIWNLWCILCYIIYMIWYDIILY